MPRTVRLKSRGTDYTVKLPTTMPGNAAVTMKVPGSKSWKMRVHLCVRNTKGQIDAVAPSSVPAAMRKDVEAAVLEATAKGWGKPVEK